MAEDDRARWDERYAAGDWADIGEPARILEDAEAWLGEPGLALDVACGAGRNALWLARRGFKVVAVDISWEGLQRLQRRARDEKLDIHIVLADLENFALGDRGSGWRHPARLRAGARRTEAGLWGFRDAAL
jgi:SAM-dependent methyltransferase